MKCMIIAALAIVAAVQTNALGAKFRGLGGGSEGSSIGEILGGSASGGGYGHSDYTGGSSSYGDSVYGAGAHSAGHKVGEKMEFFDQYTHHHKASDVDVGGDTEVGQGGHSLHGENNHGAGGEHYGHQYNQGGYSSV